ncbi:MAG: argininosuccinate lyase [Halothermotrichaceae bacterium]
MKLWGGRFNKQTDQLVHDFNASLKFDKRLYHYDIMGSIAHAEMLIKQELLTEKEGNKIINGLKQIEEKINNKEIEFDTAFEDIHSFIEAKLTDLIGSVGGKLHTARSRNDQVALDIRLYLREEIKNIEKLLQIFMKELLELAGKYKGVYMTGYTHLQRAQVITLSHHLLAYYFKLKRDYQRLEDNLKRVNVLPLGSGALAGTTFPIDRKWVADKLGFDKVCQNSIDGVSDRDFIIEFLSIASTIVMHLSRFSEEIILWSSKEFSFIELDDAYSTGSSIMPQKKNPDIAELVRGKTGRIYGHLMQLLTVLKGLPLAYNKDMQEDKEGLFDTIDNLKVMLKLFPEMIATMKVNQEKMMNACKTGFLNATDLADYLAVKGVPFRKAHGIVGKAVLYAIDNGLELEKIKLETWHEIFPDLKEYLSDDLYKYLKIDNMVENRDIVGGPAVKQTSKVIENEKHWLSKL